MLCCLGGKVRRAPTCFQQNDLVVLAQVHEAGDAFGELHHVLDGVGDVVRALLPHPLGRLRERHGKRSSVRRSSATAGRRLPVFPSVGHAPCSGTRASPRLNTAPR